MNDVFYEYFIKKMGKKFCDKINIVVQAMLKLGKANTYGIVRELCAINGKSFKTNDMFLYRFLKDSKFKIDNDFLNCHIKLLFNFMESQKLIKKDNKIPINVDFTSCNNDFLILSASVMINEKAVMLYFAVQDYPKSKKSLDQKQMEAEFIKELRNILPKEYEYIIVADRGFGNKRFAELCEKNNFEYVLRIKGNLNLKIDEKLVKLEDYNDTNTEFSAYVPTWGKTAHFVTKTKEKSTWFLLTNVKNDDPGKLYEKRFKIEKCFQDHKSSGFDIEKTQIKKCDRFKRLFYLVGLSHMFAVFLGMFLTSKDHSIKKNFPLHIGVTSVFLNSELKHSSHFLSDLSKLSIN